MRRVFSRVTIAALIVALASLAVMAAGASAANNKAQDKTSFVYGSEGGFTTLDWSQVYQGNPEREAGFELGGTLFQWDTSKLRGNGCNQFAGAGDIKPELAESATYSEADKAWTIKLRTNAKGPEGNAVTAADVKYTFDRLIFNKQSVVNFLMNSVAYYGTTLGDVATNPIEVVNPSTFKLHVKAKTSVDLTVLTWFQFRILDSAAAKSHATSDDAYSNAWLKNNNPGYGPWQISGWAPGSALFLTPNKNYWGPRGNIKKEIIKSIPDASTRRQLLQSGQLDFAQKLSYSDYISLTQAGTKSTGVTVQRCFGADRTTILLNYKDPILQKLKVRQALSLATDRGELAKGGYLGQFPKANWGVGAAYSFKKTAAGTFPAVDVTGAKKLLADAGYPNGFDLNMIYSPTRPGPEADQISVLVKAQWAKIGVNVSFTRIAASADFQAAFTAGKYQSMLYLEPPAVGDVFYSLNLYNTTASFQNTFGYNNADYDRLVGEIRVTPAGPAREARVSKVSEIIVDTVPVIYVTDNLFLHAVRDRFTGWTHAANGEIYAYTLTATK